MNILIIFTYDVSLKNWHDQGLLFREISLYKELEKADKNLRFTFLTFGDKNDYEIQKLNNLENFTVIPIYSYVKKSKFNFINLIKSIYFPYRFKNILFKDINLIKTNQLNGSWIAIILGGILKTNIIIRTGFSPYLFSIFSRKGLVKKYLYKLLTKISIHYSSLYTVTSNSEKKDLEKLLKIKNSKIEIRSNWVFYDHFKSLQDRKENVILTVGRIEEQKNYFELVDQLKDSKFIIDLVGNGSLKEKLRIYANKQNVKINFLGNIDNNELLQLYKKYKYYAIFSDYEGNPKSLKEAMASGCIAIAKDIDNTKEIIENEINGILINTKDNNLVKILENLNTNSEAERVLSENAYKSMEIYSLDRYVKKELKDYYNLQ